MSYVYIFKSHCAYICHLWMHLELATDIFFKNLYEWKWNQLLISVFKNLYVLQLFLFYFNIHSCDVWTVIYTVGMELEPVVYNSYV